MEGQATSTKQLAMFVVLGLLEQTLSPLWLLAMWSKLPQAFAPTSMPTVAWLKWLVSPTCPARHVP